jgi:methionyl-tRNA synthetase
LNRYVEEREPWKQAKLPEAAGDLDVTLASLVHGIRVVTRELAPYMPATAATLTAALDADRLAPIPQLFPKHDA